MSPHASPSASFDPRDPVVARPAPAPAAAGASLRDHLQAVLGASYTVERELGRGGMGAVFLARDTALERLVAIKVLPPELATQAQLRERFLRETRTVAGFSHPNIVPVHAVEQRDDLLLYVMGFVDGESLAERVRRGGPLAAPDAVRLLQEVAWALAYAHGHGVVHRDVKPDNILLERATGRALVTDFGIARAATGGTLTSLGEVMGTPHFMSPEQAAGEPLDGRSDLYSLGVTAFLAVTGRLPFDAPTTQALLAMHLTQPAPHVAELRPDLPAALCEVIDRCLAKEPADRFATGELLVQALEPVRASTPQIAPPVRLYLQQGDVSLRMTLSLFAIGPTMLTVIAPQDQAARIAWLTAWAMGLLAIARGFVERTRALLRQGFRYGDVAAAAATLVAETEAVRLALRADPVEGPRLRRERLLHPLAIVLGALLVVLAFRYGATEVGEVREFGLLGSSVMLLGFAMMAFGFISLVTGSMRTTPLQRLAPRLWRGPVGRALFRLAARGLRGTDAGATRSGPLQTTAAGHASPLATWEALPRAGRRQLAGVRPGLERLEQRLAELRDRQLRLDAALGEARQGGAGRGGEAPSARQQALLDDLTAARRAVGEELARLLEAREAVRLQLLRVRAGIGSATDVEAELRTAAS